MAEFVLYPLTSILIQLQELNLVPVLFFETQQRKSHEISFSLFQFPEFGVFDALKQDVGEILTLLFTTLFLKLLNSGRGGLLRVHNHALN